MEEDFIKEINVNEELDRLAHKNQVLAESFRANPNWNVILEQKRVIEEILSFCDADARDFLDSQDY